MNNEYIIINKTAIQKRIEELEKQYILLSNKSNRSLSDIEEEREIIGEQKALAVALSQSTPLIPEISKAYDAGIKDKELSQMFDNPKGRYVYNLKLDI